MLWELDYNALLKGTSCNDDNTRLVQKAGTDEKSLGLTEKVLPGGWGLCPVDESSESISGCVWIVVRR